MRASLPQQEVWRRVEHLLVDFSTSFVRRNLIDRKEGEGSMRERGAVGGGNSVS